MIKKYKEMSCPVCNKFYFSELDENDLKNENFGFCLKCGWKYDLDQTQNPDKPEGLNSKSLNEYKKEYEAIIANNPEYDYLESVHVTTPHKCPVCGKYEFKDESTFDCCPYCGWIDDSLMEKEPDKWEGCANDLCLNDYRERYKKILQRKKDYKYSKDGLI